MGAPLLSVDDASIHFGGIRALDGVSLHVQQGSIAALIGPNGAGKTTLFNCVTGLYKLDGGSVTFDGAELTHVAAHKMVGVGLARTFQHPVLSEDLTVCENVMLGAHHRLRAGFVRSALRGRVVRSEERRARAEALDALAYLGLEHVAQRRPGELPFGIVKRLEIARALLAQPRLMLLDEPASGLNHSELDDISETIRRLRDERGMTVLVVEHHMGLVMSISDRVTVLDAGRTIAAGTPAEVQADPAVQAAYLGEPAA